MLSKSITAELRAKELATGLSLLVEGVSWCLGHPTRGLDPLPDGLTQAQIDAINSVVAAHVYVEPTLPPDILGFKTWLKANVTFALRNLIKQTYADFVEDLNSKDWPEFQTGCQYVRTTLTTVQLSNGQWTAFKMAITTYKIPVTLT